LGIQNFLKYKHGRNPCKGMKMEEFTEKLHMLEKKYGVKLLLDADDFQVTKTKALPCPLKVGETVTAERLAPGRANNEMLAVAKERTISIRNTSKLGRIKVKITRIKHNIVQGKF